MSEHITDRELDEIHADPALTRTVSLMVSAGEVEVATAVMWLEDDVLTKTDGVVHE